MKALIQEVLRTRNEFKRARVEMERCEKAFDQACGRVIEELLTSSASVFCYVLGDQTIVWNGKTDCQPKDAFEFYHTTVLDRQEGQP